MDKLGKKKSKTGAPYGEIIEKLPFGYAYCKIIKNKRGIPQDFEFIEVNPAFESFTGLKASKLIGKKRSELSKNNKSRILEWKKLYGEIAVKGGRKEFEIFHEPHGRRHKISIYSPKKYYFVMTITGNSEKIEKPYENTVMPGAVHDIVFELDKDYVFLKAFTSDEKYLFIPKEELIGKSIKEVFGNEEANIFIPILKKCKNTSNKEKIIYKSPLPGDDKVYMAETYYTELGSINKYIVQITNISKQAKLKDELLNKTEQLEKFFSVNLDLLCIADMDGNFIRVNKAWEEILGYPKEELENKKFLEFIHPEDIKKTMEAISTLKEQEEIINFVNRYRCKDGSYKYIEWRSRPHGPLIYAAARDITDHINTKKQLQEKKEQFELAINGSNDGIWDWDIKNNSLYLSPKWKKQLGYKEDELSNEYKTFERLLYPGDKEMVKRKIRKYLNGEILVYDFEFRMLHKDGGYRWIRARGEALRDKYGKAYRMAGSHTDITRRKKREEELKSSEAKFKAYTRNAPTGIFISNNKGNFVEVNQTGYKMAGYTEKELLSMSILDFMAPEFHKEGKKMFDKLQKKGYVKGDIIGRRKNGERFWASLSAAKIGENRIIGYSQDITSRKNAEQRTLNAHNQMLKIFDSIDALIYVIDIKNYKILFINKFGIDRWGGLKGKTCWKVLYNRSSPCPFCKMDKIVDKNGEPSKDYRWEYEEQDSGKWYSCVERAIRWNDGRIVKLHVAYDITEIKKAQKRLKENEKYLRTILDTTQDGFWVINNKGKITDVNEAYTRMSGYSKEELLKMGIRDLEAVEAPKETKARLKRIKDHGYELFETRHRKKDGSMFDVEVSVSLFNNNLDMICFCRDISQRKKAEEVIFNEKEQFRTTLLSVGDGVISTDSKGNIIVINQIAETLTGWSQKEAIGKPLEEVFRIINENTREECKNPAQEVLKTGEIYEIANHTLLLSKNGQEIPIEDSAAPIKDRHGKISGVVIVFRDYTDKKEKQRQVEYLSFHDHLTGLYNRRYIEDSLKRLDSNRNLPFSIMVLDVNGLKLVNDAFGHKKGDKLLKKVAEIIIKACRSDDIVGRIGGDEFIILFPKTSEKYMETIKKRIIKAASNTSLESVIVSLAIGYAVKNSKEQDIMETQKLADNAMYRNKMRYGKNMRSMTIETVLRNINNKYDREQIHTEMVSRYCEQIGLAMELDNKEINGLKTAGILHDIGKIIVPPEILNKTGRLTKEEMQIVRQHSETGYQILKNVDEYRDLAEIILYHHEHWDGNGYPKGLKGKDIPLKSRIIAVADAYEAMTSPRSYQKTKSKKEAIKELKNCAGTHFDPYIVKVFIEKVLLKKN